MTQRIELGHLPPTKEILQFRQSGPLTSAMQELTANPTFKVALAALKTLTEPRTLPKPQQGNHPDTTTAHHLYMQMGAWQAIQYLLDLAVPLRTGAADYNPEEEFIHNLPAEYLTPESLTQ